MVNLVLVRHITAIPQAAPSQIALRLKPSKTNNAWSSLASGVSIGVIAIRDRPASRPHPERMIGTMTYHPQLPVDRAMVTARRCDEYHQERCRQGRNHPPGDLQEASKRGCGERNQIAVNAGPPAVDIQEGIVEEKPPNAGADGGERRRNR